MRKQIISTLLVGTLLVASVAPAASAATATTNGTTTVYAPTEIVDVVVPTSVKLAFNPLGVNVKNADFNGNGQILSGTYAIQNRSTIPMKVSAMFKVTAGTETVLSTADKVEEINQMTDQSKQKATFSLDLVTTAYGSAPTVPQPAATKDPASTDQSRPDTSMTGNASTNVVKIGKASTQKTELKTAAGDTVEFMLNAGPYTAVYDDTVGDIVYKENTKGVYDSVAFQFTGTTVTNAALWDKVNTAPTVAVTYTLSEETPVGYASTSFSPYSKNVIQKAGDITVKVPKTGAATFTGGSDSKGTLTLPTSKVNATIKYSYEDGTPSVDVNANNTVSVLNLKPGSKAVTYKLADFGTYTAGITKSVKADGSDVMVNVKNPANSKDPAIQYPAYVFDGKYTFKPDGAAATALEVGFYKVTVGGQIFIMQVTA